MRARAAGLDALHAALRTERRRNGRRASLIGFLGVSTFFAFDLLFGELLGWPLWRGHLGLFAVTWTAAGALYLLARRHQAVAERAALVVSLAFMPFSFVLVRDFVGNIWDRRDGPATFLNVVFGWLIVVVGLSLDGRQIALAAAVATVLGAAIQIYVAAPPEVVALCVAATLLGAATVAYASGRALALIADVATEHERRERLGRYFSPQVAALLAERGDDNATGESRDVTVLFADLRGFTALAERLPGPAVVALLNECHEHLVTAIFANGGTLDKYLGDGLMAYFGAPVEQPDHAARAVRCGLAMHEELAALNGARAVRGESPLAMGVGIHTGAVVLGDIGARRRREYTAIGDTVNVAARVQELTKEVGVPLLVTEETRRRVPELSFVRAPALTIRGRSQPLACYTPGPDV